MCFHQLTQSEKLLILRKDTDCFTQSPVSDGISLFPIYFIWILVKHCVTIRRCGAAYTDHITHPLTESKEVWPAERCRRISSQSETQKAQRLLLNNLDANGDFKNLKWKIQNFVSSPVFSFLSNSSVFFCFRRQYKTSPARMSNWSTVSV